MNLQQLQSEEGWHFFDISINLKHFVRLFGKVGVSGWYRLLSNSQHIFLGKTNREFFKTSFSEGFYRYSIFNDEVNIVLFLKSRDLNNWERIIKELIIRMKKMLFVRVRVGNMAEIPREDMMILNSPNGIRHYQKILETYCKQCSPKAPLPTSNSKRFF
jgi:hypothetical protein